MFSFLEIYAAVWWRDVLRRGVAERGANEATVATRVLLLLVLLVTAAGAQTRPRPDWADIGVVIDPGHGDRGTAAVPADPGAHAESVHGTAWECVFTWDTALRLKRAAEARGVKTFLTLADEKGDYHPQAWSPDRFPGLAQFRFKTLVQDPSPASVDDALYARVAAANRFYAENRDKDVYFISLHFDVAATDLAGMSFYYPAWEGGGGPFVDLLTDEMRAAGRARTNLDTGREVKVSQAHRYAILSNSHNPDSYLIELGNLASLDRSGGNPDLWRMRDQASRQEYAELILRAIGRAHRAERPRARPVTHFSRKRMALALAGLLVVPFAWAVWWGRRRRECA